MKIYTIDSVVECLKAIDEIRSLGLSKKVATTMQPTKILFRGQANINWALLPSLFRKEKYYNHEKEIISEIIRQMPYVFKDCNTDLEKLIKMQHFGAPTRLLDLTGNPLVALYFACVGQPDYDGIITVHDLPLFSNDTIENMLPWGNNWDEGSEADIVFHKEHVVASFKAPLNFQRMRNQDGYFVLYCYCGEFKQYNWSPIDKGSRYNIGNIIIPKNKKEKVIRELSLYGIKKSFLFPDLQNQIESIVDDVIND